MKVIWAIDPLQETNGLQEKIVGTIRELRESTGSRIEVQPVYVLPPDAADLKTLAELTMRRVLAEVNLIGLGEARILENGIFTTDGAARKLVAHAERIGADLIVAGTHGRRGLSRLFLGSFVASLIAQATVPVITINPGASAAERIRHILYPTDCAPASPAVFQQLLPLARRLGATVTVLHVGPESSRAQRFLDEANEAGVMALFRNEPADREVEDIVVSFARNNDIQLIALAGEKSALSAALTGSISRQIVRHASCPVWTLNAAALGLVRRNREGQLPAA